MIMVTEALPVGCVSCFEEDDTSERRPSSSSQSMDPTSAMADMSLGASSLASTSSENKGDGFEGLEKVQTAPSAIETPPESPRVAALQNAMFGGFRRDSSYRKTWDEKDRARALPCEGCDLTLPKRTKPGSTKLDDITPPLRTRKPYERISVSQEQPSPPKSESSLSSDSDQASTQRPSHRRTRSRTLGRATTSSSNSSFNSTTSHNHYIDYTSTHVPRSPTTFSIIRQSCLRTLSCETLPPQSPISPNLSTFSQISQNNSSPTGGSLFFGDPLAGYTTAFIFRIVDPLARGRRRIYALIAHSTHRERAALQNYTFLCAAFRDIAAWIQGLADMELERSETRDNTPTSSFLSSRNRANEGRGVLVKERGLAEILGMQDFFIELHARFVRVLVELGVLMAN